MTSASEELGLDELVESVERVLGDLLDARALQLIADGDRSIEQRIWSTARSLGWLSTGIKVDQGGLGMGITGISALQRALGAALAPGPFMPTLIAAQLLQTWEAASDTVAALIAGDVSAAILADFSSTDHICWDGKQLKAPTTLTMFGAPDAQFCLVPTGSGSVLLCETGAQLSHTLDSWDRSRTLFDIASVSLVPLMEGDKQQVARLKQLFLLLLTADSLGGSEAILLHTINYMKMREQFGQVIGSFQALKHRAANLSADIVTGERIFEQVKESYNGVASGLWSQLAKAAVSEVYVRTASDAVQLHGGIGYTWEHSCHLYLKRARLNEALCDRNSALRDAAASDLVELLNIGADVMEIAV